MAVHMKKIRVAKLKHPMQPIGYDETGEIIRFKQNAIVRYILDFGTLDLNAIALLPFTVEDRVQFAQLIGYSVSGFGDLPYVPKKVVAEADAVADPKIAPE